VTPKSSFPLFSRELSDSGTSHRPLVFYTVRTDFLLKRNIPLPLSADGHEVPQQNRESAACLHYLADRRDEEGWKENHPAEQQLDK
jgi:hypothetical protein